MDIKRILTMTPATVMGMLIRMSHNETRGDNQGY